MMFFITQVEKARPMKGGDAIVAVVEENILMMENEGKKRPMMKEDYAVATVLEEKRLMMEDKEGKRRSMEIDDVVVVGVVEEKKKLTMDVEGNKRPKEEINNTINDIKKVKLYMKEDLFYESDNDDFGCVYEYMPSEEDEEYNSQADARMLLIDVNNILSRFPNIVDVPINSIKEIVQEHEGTDIDFTSNGSAIEERIIGEHISAVLDKTNVEAEDYSDTISNWHAAETPKEKRRRSIEDRISRDRSKHPLIDLFTDSDAIIEMSIWQCIMVYSGYMKSKQTRYRTT